jgi:hypothetical protein
LFLVAAILVAACSRRDDAIEPRGIATADVIRTTSQSDSPDAFTFDADVYTTTEILEPKSEAPSPTRALIAGVEVPQREEVLRGRTGFHLAFSDNGTTVTIRYTAPRKQAPTQRSAGTRELVDWTKIREITMSSELAAPQIVLTDGKAVDMANLPFGNTHSRAREGTRPLTAEQRRDQMRNILRPFVRSRVGTEARVPAYIAPSADRASDSTAIWRGVGENFEVLNSRAVAMPTSGKSPMRSMRIDVVDARISAAPSDAKPE